MPSHIIILKTIGNHLRFGVRKQLRNFHAEPLFENIGYDVIRHILIYRCDYYLRKDIRHKQHNLEELTHKRPFINIKSENKGKRRNQKQIYRFEYKRIFNFAPPACSEKYTTGVFEVV